jgi:hypothetical protein
VVGHAGQESCRPKSCSPNNSVVDKELGRVDFGDVVGCRLLPNVTRGGNDPHVVPGLIGQTAAVHDAAHALNQRRRGWRRALIGRSYVRDDARLRKEARAGDMRACLPLKKVRLVRSR